MILRDYKPKPPSSNKKSSRSPGVKKKNEKINNSKVTVVVRVRPLTQIELNSLANIVVKVENDQVVTVNDPKSKQSLNDPLYRQKEAKYAFDLALDTNATNKILYERAVKGVVNTVMKGRHGTVFAYGATGHGKTYTMAGSGDESNPGVMYMTIRDLFKSIEKQNYEIQVKASYLEIYNEQLIDLLSDTPTTLDIREDRQRGISVAGITEYIMENANDVFDVLEKGAENRTTDSHALNEASSRSHAVLMINVTQYTPRTLSSNLTMIDLAGSERAKKTGTDRKALREAAKINRSLLSLANCINALASQKKGLYIPYRDSKLTRLLKESLGAGNVHTVMIANISCASTQFDEVRETLLYANRAKNIKVTAKLMAKTKTIITPTEDNAYAKLVTDLQNDLYDLKDTLTPNRSLPMDLSMSLNAPIKAPIKPKSPKLPKSSIKFSQQSYNNNNNNNNIDEKKENGPLQMKRQLSMTTQNWNKTQILVDKIVSNFQDRIQIRRSLVELDEIDNENHRELSQYDAMLSGINNGTSSLNSNEIQQLKLDRDSVIATIKENAVYREKQMDELHELKVEGAQLRRNLDSQDSLNEEREQIVQLTLDRCVLELQKMDVELRERESVKKLDMKEAEIDYYKRILEDNSIQFVPFDSSRLSDVSASRRLPLPKAPDLLKTPGTDENNPSLLDSRVREALATPKQKTSSFGFRRHSPFASTPNFLNVTETENSYNSSSDNDNSPRQPVSSKNRISYRKSNSPYTKLNNNNNNTSPRTNNNQNQNQNYYIRQNNHGNSPIAAVPTKDFPNIDRSPIVPKGALRALKNKMKKRQSRGMSKAFSAMDLTSLQSSPQTRDVNRSVQLPDNRFQVIEEPNVDEQLDRFIRDHTKAQKRSLGPQPPTTSKPPPSYTESVEVAAHRRVLNRRRF